MRKFVLSLIVFAAIITAFAFVMNRNYYPAKAMGHDGYMGSILDKHAYAEKNKSPRILFVGGSNLAFGIDSKSIEAAVKLPVVNMGISAGLGLTFMLNEAKDVARPSDIVIVSSEYNLAADGDYKLKKEAERLFLRAGKYFDHPPRQILNDYFISDLQHNFSTTFSHLLNRTYQFPSNLVYSRTSFNENGDIVRNYDPNLTHEFIQKADIVAEKNPGIGPLNDFKEFADAHHFKTYFLYPILDETAYTPKSKIIQAIGRDLKGNLKMEILNTPEDSVYPDSLFYDTEYHLTLKGKKLRGEQIIRIFKSKGIGIVGNVH